MRLTRSNLQRRLKEIARQSSTSPEIAHSMEDALYREYVQEIADVLRSYASEPLISQHEALYEVARKASLVLRSRRIQFARWPEAS